jgi:hypothetical protein
MGTQMPWKCAVMRAEDMVAGVLVHADFPG